LEAAFIKARRWLAESQCRDVLLRVNEAAEKVVLALGGELSDEAATEVLLTTHVNLQATVLQFERSLIKQALAKVNGKVTYAASLLGLSHQGLAYVIDSRHKELLKVRSPVRRRPRGKKSKTKD
jgi:transcriptional regulator with GAF, ATPase, and Fis domain